MKTLVNVDEKMNQEINKLKSRNLCHQIPEYFRLDDTNIAVPR